MFDPESPEYNRRWAQWRRRVDLDEYEARFERLARERSPHGEADAVTRLLPHGGSVLDAGCGMGRITMELADRGHDVVGVDVDADMLARAEARRPDITWVLADIAAVDLGRRFDLVLLAGNVMLFVADGTEAAAIANMARHLAPGGLLVAGFSLSGQPASGISLDDYDAACRAAGLTLADRWATWEGEPFAPASGSPDTYAVSIHRAG